MKKYKAIIHHPTIYDTRGQNTIGIKQKAYDEECEIELIEKINSEQTFKQAIERLNINLGE